MSTAWVIGAGGLLGSSLVHTLQEVRTQVFRSPQPFAWNDAARLREQLGQAVAAFAREAGSGDWEIYWAAGTGTMRSSESDLAPETAALEHLLREVEGTPALHGGRGRLCLASSAGAIYAGCPDRTISEESAAAPPTPYAAAKLAQEQLVREFVQRRGDGTVALLARISTLYGAGQARGKAQGLITHIARQLVRNEPVHIFVPLDTIRDYIAVEDAAARIVAAARALERGSGATVRIVASEKPATIAEIVSIYRRLSRRRPSIVTSANRQTAVYARCVQFRSSRQELAGVRPLQPLPLGIARVLESERKAHARGI